MRNYGLSRYASYNRYRPTSLYSRSRTSIYQRLASKSTSAATAQKAYQTTTAAKTTYSGSLSSAVSGVAASVSEMSRAMSGTDREKMYDAAKNFVESCNDMYTAVGNSRSAFVSGQTSVMANAVKAYSGALENAGVTVGDDGRLSLDKEKFMSADNNAISSAFGTNSAFTGAAVSQAVNVSRYANSESYYGFGGYNSYGGYPNNDLFGYAGTTRNGALAGYLLNKWF